jgi:mono/diheme cytochrome c family protein
VKRLLLGILIAAVAVAGMGVVSYLLLVGPRMYDQPHVRAFQAVMPTTPPGAVPLLEPVPPLPSPEEAKALANTLQPTPENLARGKVYYQFYCTFCHGERGDGNGPVGESFVPVPSDLRAAKVRGYSDGQILRAMLTGTGHDPVMNQTVRPQHRWYLVLYVRSFKPPAP